MADISHGCWINRQRIGRQIRIVIIVQQAAPSANKVRRCAAFIYGNGVIVSNWRAPQGNIAHSPNSDCIGHYVAISIIRKSDPQ